MPQVKDLFLTLLTNPSAYTLAFTVTFACVAVASVPIPNDLNATLIALFAVCMLAA